VLGLSKRVESRVRQNDSINMFEEYFAEDTSPTQWATPPSAKTLTIFRDPSSRSPRAVSRVCWHPESVERVASLHCSLSFEALNCGAQRPQSAEPEVISSFIWDCSNPNRPLFRIDPESAICCMAFNKKNADTLVGGCYNGILGVWDLRKAGNKAVESTVIESGHSDPIYAVEWIQSRTGTEFVSVSTDGSICWWDARKLGTGPMDQMLLRDEQSEDESGSASNMLYGGTSLEYRTDAGATKYLVGTEQGTILSVERKAKKDGDSQKQLKLVYDQSTEYRHHGPVYSLCRNYFIPKCILSVGDWMARIWAEDCRTPIMSTRYEHSYLTSGQWSPSRPGVFFLSKQDGTLDVWDYYFKGQFEPSLSVKVSDHHSLSDVAVSPKGGSKFVAVGAADGSVTVLELCKSLYESQNLNAEKQAMAALFERETNREKGLQAAKLAQRRALKALQKKKKAAPNKKPEPEKKRDLADFGNLEAEFLEFIEKNRPQRSDPLGVEAAEKENNEASANQ